MDIIFGITSLPFDIPGILKFGIIGLGAILAILTFWLLRGEQRKPEASRRMISAIFTFMVFSLFLVTLGLLSKTGTQSYIQGYTVPAQEKQIVENLPVENLENYNLLKDISIFDLRGWKPVPADKLNERYSPANYINYLHIKKTRPLDSIVIHYATSGYDIDLRCITHNYKNYQQDTTTKEHKGQKSYGIAIDVSSVPLNEEFLVVVEATYWNGFRDITKESASTYTDAEITGLNELDLIILLPYDKPVNSVAKYSRTDREFYPYRGEEKFYVDEKKRFIYWSVKKITADTHYKLDWTW